MDTINDDIYPGFEVIQTLAKVAGILGVMQSIGWIGLSITGILAFYCITKLPTAINLSAINDITFYEIYFHQSGECLENHELVLQIPELAVLKDIAVLTPEKLHIWVWVYLVLNALWFMSSISLITMIDKRHLRKANVALYVWVFITLFISCLDLGLGIIYGIDFNEFRKMSENYHIQNEKKLPEGVVVNSAKMSSTFMMIIALKGFVLWIINVIFLIYFFTETFIINEAATARVSLLHRDFISETQSIATIIRSPIEAYEAKTSFTNHSVNKDGVKQRSSKGNGTILHLNVEPLKKANRMSLATLEERRLNKFEQYPAISAPATISNGRISELLLPAPDYTPPNTIRKPTSFREPRCLKNTRYQ